MDPILTPAELDELRQEELSMMLDRCTLRRPTGRGEQDEETGLQEPAFETLADDHPCQIRLGVDAGGKNVRTVNIGGADYVVLEGGVKLPLDGPILRELDEVVITQLGPSTDLSLASAVLTVVGVGGGTWSTARRVDVVRR